MNKKILSAILAGAMSISVLTAPVSAASEGTETVTYSPKNWLYRYGSIHSRTGRPAVSVNKLARNKDNTGEATGRTDQDDYYSQFLIAVPEAIEKIEISIPGIQLKKKTVNVLDEEGNPTGETIETDAIMGTSIRYSTTMNDLPADGEYYVYTEDDVEKAVGGTVDEVKEIMLTWENNLFKNTTKAKLLIDQITPATFGVTDATTTGKLYNVKKDITDVVKEDLIAAADETGSAYFDVIFCPSATYGIWKRGQDYFQNGTPNWAKDISLSVTYDADVIIDDLNSSANGEELKQKTVKYAPVFGGNLSSIRDEILSEKIVGYVGRTFTKESFKQMINDLQPVDITTYQVDISDKFNYSNWGILNETVTSDTFEPSTAGAFVFPEEGSIISEYVLNAVDVVAETDSEGNVTYNKVENGDVITFKFDPSTYSANVNNYYDAGFNNTIEITGNAKYAKRVYLALSNIKNHNFEFAPIITYTDGTKEAAKVQSMNVGIGGWNTSSSFAGAMEIGKAALGSITWRKAAAVENEDGSTTVGDVSSSGGIAFHKFDVNPKKIIDKITIDNTTNTAAALFAVAETVMSNAELLAEIREAEKFNKATSENHETILTAKAYADELINRNAAIASDFTKLNELYKDAEWYSKKQDSKSNMLDITEVLNADYLAPLGSKVDNVIPSGLHGTYAPGWLTSTPTGTIPTSIYNDGVRTVDEYGYVLNNELTAENGKDTYDFLPTGRKIDFATPAERLEAGVKDAIVIPGGGESVVIKASGERAEKLYLIVDPMGASLSPSVKVTYSDGTSEQNGIYMGAWDHIYVGNKYKDKKYPAFAGAVWLGKYNSWGTDENNTVVLANGSVYPGVPVFSVELDSAKVPVSYEIIADSAYQTTIYGVSELTMTNDDMIAVVNEAKALEYVSNAEQAALVRRAEVYARELDARHAVKYEDNAVLAQLVEQAEYQEDKYLDLSDKVDTDLIVNVGEQRPADYNGRDDYLYQTMPSTVTMRYPANSDYIDYESGMTFKLSGGYDGNGNDAVKVKSKENGGIGVKFDLGGKMLKHISFLADCVDNKISVSTGATVYATVKYTDGSSETVEGNLRRGDTWYSLQYSAVTADNCVKYAHYDEATNTYMAEVLNPDKNKTDERMTCFGFDISGFDAYTDEYSEYKTVESIELIPHNTAEYHIFAVTAQAYSNDVLLNELGVFLDDVGITDVSEVTEENAQAVINGVNVIEELYKRHYAEIDNESYNAFLPLRTAAYKALGMSGTVTFTPSVEIENGTVSAKLAMVNTTETDEAYVLIVAAYSADNQLVGVNKVSGVLSANTDTDSSSVSIDIPQNAVTYKAMVWKGIDSMIPIAVASK